MELSRKRQDIKEKEQLEQQQKSERDEILKMQGDLKVRALSLLPRFAR